MLRMAKRQSLAETATSKNMMHPVDSTVSQTRKQQGRRREGAKREGGRGGERERESGSESQGGREKESEGISG